MFTWDALPDSAKPIVKNILKKDARHSGFVVGWSACSLKKADAKMRLRLRHELGRGQ